jgi:type I restriction enzyme S subunit
MKKGWRAKNLGDLCQVIGGGTPSKDKAEYYSGRIPWATVRDMRSDVITETECKITKEAVKASATNIIPKGNVVIATRVGLGKVCLLGQDTAINQDLRGIVPIDPKVLAVRFLFWWLKSIAATIVAEGTGATVQGVKLPFVKSLQLPLPPLPEQQWIVGILDEAFEGIATAKANADKNLKNARALFESHLQSVFTKRGLGWIDRQLASLCREITVGHVGPMAKEYKENGVPFLRSQNVRPFELALENVVFIDKAFHRSLEKSRLRPGDLAIVRTGYPGTAAVIPPELPDANCADLVIVRPSPEVSPHFLAAFFNSAFGKHLVLGKLVGAAQKHFNITAAKEVMLHVPPIAEQQAIVDMIGALRKDTQYLESVYRQKLAALEALKQSLLQQAFAGKL